MPCYTEKELVLKSCIDVTFGIAFAYGVYLIFKHKKRNQFDEQLNKPLLV